MLSINSKNKIASIGDFDVLKLLVSSNFSYIYLVQERKKPFKRFIIKQLKSNKNRKRIDSEVCVLNIMNGCKHSLKFYEISKLSNSYIFRLEYAEGGNLREHIKKNGALTESESLVFLQNMIGMLKFAHKNNIIHKDIKAENIVRKDGKYYLIDWNISSINEKEKTLHIKSDDNITAPEIYHGEYDNKIDIYSLGCTLYYILHGYEIYNFNKKSNFAQKMYSHLYLDVQYKADLSNKIKYLLSKMLEKDPLKRVTLEEIENILKSKENTFELKETKKIECVNFKNQFLLYKNMADDGIPYAQNILGLIYNESLYNVIKDETKALYWYEKAAKKGLIKAFFNLGFYYYKKEEYKKAYSYLYEAIKENHERSYYVLGKMYENGYFIKKDISKACEYYKLSAYHGYKKAYEKVDFCKEFKCLFNENMGA